MIETPDEAVTYLEMVARRESGDLAEAALIVTRTLRLSEERDRLAEAENEALIQTSGDLCEACGWRGKRGGSCAFCENAALRAERNELLHQQQNGYPSVEEVGIEGLRQHIKGLEAERDDLKRKGELLCQAYGEHLIEHGSGGRCGAERDRLRESRDGMLREAVRALEHWLAKGAKVVWTPYLTPSACRELLRAAGFYGADQLEHARAALASGEESREPASAGPAEEPRRLPRERCSRCEPDGDRCFPCAHGVHGPKPAEGQA